jgi:hypothetical protein
MTTYKLNKSGQDFVEMQNRKIKTAIPTFIFISLVVISGCFIRLGFNIISIIVMTFVLFVSYYINIHIARNKRQEILNNVAKKIEVDGEQCSFDLVNNKTIIKTVDKDSISKSNSNIKFSEYLKLADIWSIKNDENSIYIIPEFFDNYKETMV